MKPAIFFVPTTDNPDNFGYTLVTLYPGDERTFYTSAPTDEGWHSTGRIYRHEGNHVAYEHTEDGEDCDGRLTRYSDAECSLDRLAVIPGLMGWDGDTQPIDHPSIKVPDWRDTNSSQRDYAAEAAGY